tara:strand:+ start:2508 stop:3872 length:1365 start_codon:yes stop_codon:yes gene_type:complete
LLNLCNENKVFSLFTSTFYKNAPVMFQNLLISARAIIRLKLRDNTESKCFLKNIENNEYDKNKLDYYIGKSLRSVLTNAIENATFYGKYDSNSLKSFPILTKEDLRREPSGFFSKQKPKIIVKGSTSGTTGSPLMIPQSMESVVKEFVFVKRLLQWAGYKKGDKRAWLRGDLIVPLEQKTGTLWRYSFFEKMLMLSTFHLSKETMQLYIDKMVSYKVDIIQAYPSSIVLLARFLKENNDYYPSKLKSIITSSEQLTKDDRALIEERFQCKVFDWYGLFERVAAITNCEHGRYHLLTDYSYVELVHVSDKVYEIVGTNFNNKYYPLIRYKTGDQIVLSDEKMCPCGRVYPMVKEIIGRQVQHVYNINKDKVYALDQCVKETKGVIGSQFEQFKYGEITIHLIVNDEFDDKQKTIIENAVKSRLGSEMQVVFSFVKELKKTKNGKTIQAICHIKGS